MARLNGMNKLKLMMAALVTLLIPLLVSGASAQAETLPCEAEVFAHESVKTGYVNRVKRATQIACEFFGGLDAPLEVWISSRDSDEQEELRAQWCEHRKDRDPKFGNCRNSQIGGSNFVPWNDTNYKYYHLNIEIFSYSRDDPSAEYVTIHEYFHAWQAHQIGQMKTSEYLMSLKLGKTRDGSRPWFSEGGATYLSHYVWSKDKKAQRRHLADQMERFYVRSAKAFNEDLVVKDLRYGNWNEGGEDAYNVSSWAIAYLIYLVGLDTFLAMHADLENKTFESAFADNFGMSSDEFDAKFVDYILETNKRNRWTILLK